MGLFTNAMDPKRVIQSRLQGGQTSEGVVKSAELVEGKKEHIEVVVEVKDNKDVKINFYTEDALLDMLDNVGVVNVQSLPKTKVLVSARDTEFNGQVYINYSISKPKTEAEKKAEKEEEF